MYRNVFIGIPLPRNISKKYTSLLKKLKRPGIWQELEVESYEKDIPHITLYFLGNQEEDVEKVKKLLLNSELIIRNIEINLKSFYFEKRAFVPHLSLSRKINSKNTKSIQMIKEKTGKINWKFKADTICLLGRDSKTGKQLIL